MAYDIYCAFDLEKHKQTYVQYLEVVILEDGTVEYAVPSHQEKLIALACQKKGVSRQELNDLCPREYYYDFLTWLCMQANAVAVWNNDCCCGRGINRKQVATLRKLKMAGVYGGTIPKIWGSNFHDMNGNDNAGKENLDFASVSMYHSKHRDTRNGGEDMTSRELMDAALAKTKNSQAWLARQMGWTPQNFNLRLNRNSIRADEFLALMDVLGVDVTFTMRKTGEILKPHVSGHGRRLCGNCDKITFDTAAAEAISNSFYEDGVNEFNADGEAAELYVDSEGRYFMAEYHTDTSKDRLRTVQSSVAAAFVEKYGTQIEKEPKKE